MPATLPADVAKALQFGEPAPAGLSADEQYAWNQLDDFYKHGLAYAQEMGNRPQTLYALEDSPIGLAAWMLDHDIRSYRLITRVFAGEKEGLTPDDILDNVTLYWSGRGHDRREERYRRASGPAMRAVCLFARPTSMIVRGAARS